MLKFIIQGRGGQGAQLASEILASAFFAEGKYVQAYATYGGARRGTPVTSYVRVDDKPILLRCDIEEPDAILFFDDSLLSAGLIKCAKKNTIVLVNSAKGPEDFHSLSELQLVTIDALSIARENNLGRIVNSALIGALAGLLGVPTKDAITQIVQMKSPAKKEENAQACLTGYELVTKRGQTNE